MKAEFCNLCLDEGLKCWAPLKEVAPSIRNIEFNGTRGIIYESIEKCSKRSVILEKAGVRR